MLIGSHDSFGDAYFLFDEQLTMVKRTEAFKYRGTLAISMCPVINQEKISCHNPSTKIEQAIISFDPHKVFKTKPVKNYPYFIDENMDGPSCQTQS